MSDRIEDYALIGDGETAAMVSRSGSIDWLCMPRFDSGACFAALLETADHGFWRLAPPGSRSAARRYRDTTLVLETDSSTTPVRSPWWTACRRAKGLRLSFARSSADAARCRCGWTW